MNDEKKQAIRPEELRIGNLVWEAYSGEMTVFGIVTGGINPRVELRKNEKLPAGSYLIETLHGIKLSPEWLERLGFVLNASRDPESCSFDYMHIGLFYIGEFNGNGWLLNDFDSMPPMKYVHQLQNLFYSLTGQELKLRGVC